MNTDGNMDAIERHLADCEEHDAWQDLQDQLEAARADAKEAEAYAEELERDRNALFRRVALAEEWRDYDKTRADEAEAKLAKAEWLLTYAAVQLEDGKIKTRCNCAGQIWKFLAELKGDSHE